MGKERRDDSAKRTQSKPTRRGGDVRNQVEKRGACAIAKMQNEPILAEVLAGREVVAGCAGMCGAHVVLRNKAKEGGAGNVKT